MRRRYAGLGAALALTLAACQGSGASPALSQPPGPNPTAVPNASEPVPSVGGEVRAFDGTITWASDGSNGGSGSSTESHATMTVTVQLVIQDGGPEFVDAGSTYSYSETSRQDDAQTLSSCGLHAEGTGRGSGPFTVPDGLIVGYYSPFNSEVSLGIHAPYTETSTGTYLCNGQTISGTSPLVENPSCGDPSGSSLVGKIGRGGIVDMTCSETFAIGNGGVKVSGSLTSR